MEVLRNAGMGGRRLCVDGLRLSRRADALWMAIDQLAVRHRGYVRIPEGHLYYYKAWWGKEPSLHLFPHWNFEGREGDTIPVWVYTNLDEVELFVNGKSAGSQKVPTLAMWSGRCSTSRASIEARASKDGKVVADGEARNDRARRRSGLRRTGRRSTRTARTLVC